MDHEFKSLDVLITINRSYNLNCSWDRANRIGVVYKFIYMVRAINFYASS